ncbi:MAG: ABC transporter ATP-binding protein [Candidatus Kariarchaeaceae archaeon]|jgi:ABC-type Fe3+/spermidine/putrescine transport system ATPase subunit
MANLELQNLNIHYGDFHAVKGVDVKIGDGEIVTLLGPSGCGKTSILRSIAGFIHPSDGKVLLESDDITYLPPQKRDMGMIFQNYALWPHMTVKQNIGYGLRIRNQSKDQIENRVMHLVRQVQLEGQEDKYPGQLSGGQQQRVALARALAIEPKILLCDEPLSNLDFKLRVELRTEIRDVAKRFGVTVVYVTHDQTEALAISDTIAVMDVGELIQLGTPLEIFSDPDTHFVGRFVGENNLLKGKIAEVNGDNTVLELSSGDRINMLLKDGSAGQEVMAIIRHNNLEYTDKLSDDCIKGKIKHKAYMGHFLQLEIETADGSMVMANITENLENVVGMETGTEVYLKVEENSPLVFGMDEIRIR